MDLVEAYDKLSSLSEPVGLIEGHYGPLTDEQLGYAQMIYEGNLKSRQWIEDWLKQDRQAHTAESLARYAHKINSGLTMMLGYASLMLTGLGGPVSDDITAALNAIVAAAEQAHTAVQRSFEAPADEMPDG